MGGTRRHRKGRNCNLDMLFEGKKNLFSTKGNKFRSLLLQSHLQFYERGKITFDCSNLRKTGKSIF